MGYESKVIIYERIEAKGFDSESGFERMFVYGQKIAEYDLCCLGYDEAGERIRNTFNVELDFDMDCAEATERRTDLYGAICKYCHIDELVEALEAFEHGEHYRRIAPLIGLLKGFDQNEWKDIVCVHYGH